MLLIVMIVVGVIGILVSQELSEHLLDVIQGFLLSPRSLLLCLHPPTEVIIIVVGHVNRHMTLSHQADWAEEAYPLASFSPSDH